MGFRFDFGFSFGGASAPWTPAEITTALWLDAADASTITESGGAVSQWDDKSGNGRHVLQGTGGSQPSWASSIMTFDGTADFMATSAAATWLDGGPYNIFAVAKHASGDVGVGADYLIGTGPGAGASTALQVGQVNNFAWWFSHWADDDSISRNLNSSVFQVGHLFKSPGGELYNNGTSLGTCVGPANDLSVSTNVFEVGAARAPGVYWPGQVNEVIVIVGATVSDATRQLIEGYLAWKWDGINGDTVLVTALPALHPYKSAAPTV